MNKQKRDTVPVKKATDSMDHQHHDHATDAGRIGPVMSHAFSQEPFK